MIISFDVRRVLKRIIKLTYYCPYLIFLIVAAKNILIIRKYLLQINLNKSTLDFISD